MAVSPLKFYKTIEKNNIDFFTGVPDSLLKQFCLCIDDNIINERHIIAANEGNAIALAAGYHLATNKIPLVYMQNSGLGNAVNPLLSLWRTVSIIFTSGLAVLVTFIFMVANQKYNLDLNLLFH